MSTKSDLDLQGSLKIYPVAEVIVEISCAGLSGSLKILSGEKKAIVYFESGKPIFAVSNERIFRLAEMLLSENIVDKQFLAENKDAANELQLSERVVAAEKLSAEEMKKLVVSQCELIVRSTFDWEGGEWIYTPHSRIKAGIAYELNLRQPLIEYSRRLSSVAVSERFKSMNEWFAVTPDMNGLELQPHEAFVLSRFDSGKLNVAQLIALSGLSQEASMHTAYCLWLGGFLSRYGWCAAFTENRILQIRSANFELTKSAIELPKPARKLSTRAPVAEVPEEQPQEELVEFNLEETLMRIEGAEHYYDVLGIELSAKLHVIRKAYFRLAKQLHPDRYHSEMPEVLARVENAFTELAQAHETLKNHDSRQGYDIRMRQAQRDKEEGRRTGVESSRQEDQAAKDFERGFEHQLNGNFEEALPYLARAVYYAPQNARYHAFYGKALSADEHQRHKAENELSAAIRLEPQNESFRLMLAEFFVRYKLLKRAEGELNRLLATSPNNKQARTLLDSLAAK